jgi:hypothetical protein
VNAYILFYNDKRYPIPVVDTVHFTHDEAIMRVAELIGGPPPETPAASWRDREGRLWSRHGETHWEASDGSSFSIEGHKMSAAMDKTSVPAVQPFAVGLPPSARGLPGRAGPG